MNAKPIWSLVIGLSLVQAGLEIIRKSSFQKAWKFHKTQVSEAQYNLLWQIFDCMKAEHRLKFWICKLWRFRDLIIGSQVRQQWSRFASGAESILSFSILYAFSLWAHNCLGRMAWLILKAEIQQLQNAALIHASQTRSLVTNIYYTKFTFLARVQCGQYVLENTTTYTRFMIAYSYKLAKEEFSPNEMLHKSKASFRPFEDHKRRSCNLSVCKNLSWPKVEDCRNSSKGLPRNILHLFWVLAVMFCLIVPSLIRAGQLILGALPRFFQR